MLFFALNCRTQIEEQRTYNMQKTEYVGVEKVVIGGDNSNSSINTSIEDGISLPSTENCAWIHGIILTALLLIALAR